MDRTQKCDHSLKSCGVVCFSILPIVQCVENVSIGFELGNVRIERVNREIWWLSG